LYLIYRISNSQITKIAWQVGKTNHLKFKLKQERLAFCMCGNSKNGPYCDGSHKGTGKSLQVVTYDKDTPIFACGCQQSKGRPFCDGTHETIND